MQILVVSQCMTLQDLSSLYLVSILFGVEAKVSFTATLPLVTLREALLHTEALSDLPSLSNR